MKTLCILFLAFILNGIGFYLAYRLITWFETGRPHIEPQPLTREYRPCVTERFDSILNNMEKQWD